jgi:hypothetical protein
MAPRHHVRDYAGSAENWSAGVTSPQSGCGATTVARTMVAGGKKAHDRGANFAGNFSSKTMSL